MECIIMLTTRRNMNALGAIASYLNQNPQAMSQAMNLASAAGKTLRNALNYPQNGLLMPSGPRNVGPFQVSKLSIPPRKGSKKGKKRKTKISRPLSHPSDFTPTMEFTFVSGVSTNGANVALGVIWMGYKNTNFTASFSSISSQYQSVAGIFQWQKFHYIKVEWQPYVAYTASGNLVLSIVEDPTLAYSAPTSTQSLVQRRIKGYGDIKEPIAITWTPSDEQQRETKETADASGATGAVLRDYAPCQLAYWGTTNQTNQFIGNLVITVKVTFSGMF
jgi:hypothetical protein